MTFLSPPVIPSQSSARVLVLTCIDPRFTELTAWFLTHVKQVHSSYDLFALAGSTLGVVQARETHAGPPTWPIFENWDQVFFDHVELAVILHGITEIWFFDHLGCAAYEQFLLGPGSTDDDPAPHTDQMNTLTTYIREYTNANTELQLRVRQLVVNGFLMNLDGSIDVLIGTPTLDVFKYNKETYYWASGTLIAVTTALLVWLALHLRKQ